jgi:hypothetical protein
MEGSVLSRYNKKCNDFIKQMNENPEVEYEYMKYQMACIPFLERANHISMVNIERKKINLTNVFNPTDNNEEKQLYRDYMKEVEGIVLKSVEKKNLNVCNLCHGTNIAVGRTHDRVCMDCGSVVDMDAIEDKPSFKDMSRITHTSTAFTYKRENHFNEWLDSLEATGKTSIPDEVIEQVRYEIKKQRFTDPSKITAVIVRGILKKLKYNMYYDCIPMILSNVVGRPPLTISDDLRKDLKQMFREVHKIYHKHVPRHRSNFFSYPYILYKFCELLEADFILPYLTLLKSTEKLYQQDQIFKSICGELQWEFIKTI